MKKIFLKKADRSTSLSCPTFFPVSVAMCSFRGNYLQLPPSRRETRRDPLSPPRLLLFPLSSRVSPEGAYGEINSRVDSGTLLRLITFVAPLCLSPSPRCIITIARRRVRLVLTRRKTRTDCADARNEPIARISLIVVRYRYSFSLSLSCILIAVCEVKKLRVRCIRYQT